MAAQAQHLRCLRQCHAGRAILIPQGVLLEAQAPVGARTYLPRPRPRVSTSRASAVAVASRPRATYASAVVLACDRVRREVRDLVLGFVIEQWDSEGREGHRWAAPPPASPTTPPSDARSCPFLYARRATWAREGDRVTGQAGEHQVVSSPKRSREEGQRRLTVAELATSLDLSVSDVLRLAKGVSSPANQPSDRLDPEEAAAIRQAAVVPADGVSKAEVINLRDKTVLAEAREDFDPLLNGSELEDALQRLASNAKQMASQNLHGMSASAFDREVLGTGDDDLDARLLDAELKGTLAKHGLTPLDTIEGLSKLREFLVAAYRDTKLVEPETALKALQVGMEIQKIEATQTSLVVAHQHRVDVERIKADTERKVTQARGHATVATANADSHIESTQAMSKARSADIDRKLMDDVKKTEAYQKMLVNRRNRRRTQWNQDIKPRVRLALKIGIPLVLASNLIADAPERATTPVLAQVNEVWDAVYLPLREGVVRTVNDLADNNA